MSSTGNISVLGWWLRESGFDNLKYTKRTMDQASGTRAGCPLEYTVCLCLEWTVRVETEPWWCWNVSSGLELKYSYRAMNDDLQLRETLGATDGASEFGHIGVLEWCGSRSRGYVLSWAACAMHRASVGGVEVLEWWKGSGLESRWTRGG
ncbi:hypothetical protein BJ742DRAFT_772215 [Cladochytrium replicatum]|nr:hypothetical protein BJ742DRAFT_772215 [Cladochytrium replicatum]